MSNVKLHLRMGYQDYSMLSIHGIEFFSPITVSSSSLVESRISEANNTAYVTAKYSTYRSVNRFIIKTRYISVKLSKSSLIYAGTNWLYQMRCFYLTNTKTNREIEKDACRSSWWFYLNQTYVYSLILITCNKLNFPSNPLSSYNIARVLLPKIDRSQYH